MSPQLPRWILGLVAIDFVAGLFIVRYILARRGPGGGLKIGGIDLVALREFTNTVHPRVGEYMRANWSGVPSDLPVVLGHLLDDLERDVNERGLPIHRAMLKQMIERSLRSHHIGQGAEVREALKQVA